MAGETRTIENRAPYAMPIEGQWTAPRPRARPRVSLADVEVALWIVVAIEWSILILGGVVHGW